MIGSRRCRDEINNNKQQDWRIQARVCPIYVGRTIIIYYTVVCGGRRRGWSGIQSVTAVVVIALPRVCSAVTADPRASFRRLPRLPLVPVGRRTRRAPCWSVVAPFPADRSASKWPACAIRIRDGGRLLRRTRRLRRHRGDVVLARSARNWVACQILCRTEQNDISSSPVIDQRWFRMSEGVIWNYSTQRTRY